jgi:hypothetical protein
MFFRFLQENKMCELCLMGGWKKGECFWSEESMALEAEFINKLLEKENESQDPSLYPATPGNDHEREMGRPGAI